MADNQDPKQSEPAGSQEDAIAERTWGPLWNIRDEIDDLLEDLNAGSFFAPLRRSRRGQGHRVRGTLPGFSWKMPVLDVVDKEDEVKLTAELPGLSEDDIDLRVSGSMLTLRGEKKEDREEGDKEGDFYLSERRFGSFERSVRIPDGIDRGKIEATFKNGVLTVRLPKKPEARNPSKKIDVKPAS
ncbi:Hsp20/alpha crystallin family protein [Leisingera sp. D0M16]|uniref:Hsp20/alpha crystallin family protein n=1 Tax=Leisingera coralii TaxID=3351347 RepID=UPI003B7A6D8F